MALVPWCAPHLGLRAGYSMGLFFPRLIRLWLTASVSGQQGLSLIRDPVVQGALITLYNCVDGGEFRSYTKTTRTAVHKFKYFLTLCSLPSQEWQGKETATQMKRTAPREFSFYKTPLSVKALKCQQLGKPEKIEEKNFYYSVTQNHY